MPEPRSGAQRQTRGFGSKEWTAQQESLTCFFLLRQGYAPPKFVKIPFTATKANAA